MINDKQCTIQWYVDNNKVTHVNEDFIIGVIYITKRNFGELVVSHRKKYTFLGIETELVKDEKIKIGMISYIKEETKKSREDVSRGVTSPATIRLFGVTEGAKIFSE